MSWVDKDLAHTKDHVETDILAEKGPQSLRAVRLNHLTSFFCCGFHVPWPPRHFAAGTVGNCDPRINVARLVVMLFECMPEGAILRRRPQIAASWKRRRNANQRIRVWLLIAAEYDARRGTVSWKHQARTVNYLLNVNCWKELLNQRLAELTFGERVRNDKSKLSAGP